MVSSAAKTVDAYLDSLPEDRREDISAVRQVVRKHLPKGYVELMDFGMICYCVPLDRYPETYNDHALCYAGLAAQKNYNAVYLMGVYKSRLRTRAGHRRVVEKASMKKAVAKKVSATKAAKRKA